MTPVFLAGLFLVSLMSHIIPHTHEVLQDVEDISRSSSLTFDFNSAPSTGDQVTGSTTLSFTIGGTGTVDSINIEISSDNASFSDVKNLTSSPWLTFFDSTLFSNGSYLLKATLWDSDAEASLEAFTGTFSIVNQVPSITEFSVDNIDYGTGLASTSRCLLYTSPSPRDS